MTTSFLYQPPKPDRKVRVTQGRSFERQSDKTLEHLTRGWMPVNPQLLKIVREHVQNGEFRTNPDQVIEEIKSDPNLFMYCVREVAHEHIEDREGFDPIEALRHLEEEKLASMLRVTESQVSAHRFRHITPAQTLRYQHAVISSRTAEVLAAKSELSPQLAFSSAMLRQLGLNLISWNYPDLFTRALHLQNSAKTSLDFELQKMLGLSPLQIGARFAKSWNLAPELKHVVQPPDRSRATEEAPDLTGSGLSLLRICEIGELFAKANDAEHFPEDAKRWEKIAAKLPEDMQAAIMEDLAPRIAHSLDLYHGATDRNVWTPYFHPSPPSDAIHESARLLLKQNHHVQRCPEKVARDFEHVYRLLDPSQTSMEALRFLVDRVAPGLKFLRGCLYLAHDKDLSLRPALRIGDFPLSRYPAISQSAGNPLADSLGSRVPLKQEDLGLSGERAIRIYGSLGAGNRRAVLLVEIDPRTEQDPDYDAMQYFLAFRHALSDCLGSSLK